MVDHRLILASASPRRRELLGLICPDFEIAPSDFDESTVCAELPPVEYVVISACRKAREVADRTDDSVVIGADTVVVVNGEIMGKPADKDDAARMLRAIGGRTHQVYTGICVISAKGGARVEKSGFESTDVTVRRLTDGMIRRYIATGEPMDKAGAYAIQGRGSVLIERIKGCYFNVVGLPVYALSRLLEELGMEALDCK